MNAMITVTRREPPSDGTDWIAPWEVRCAEHGRVICRRTAAEAWRDSRPHVEREHGGMSYVLDAGER